MERMNADDPEMPRGDGQHVVRRGECMSSIAEAYGFFWPTLWDAADNAALREHRGDPNVLLPGDRVFVPDRRAKEQACETGMRHRFRRRGVPERLRMRFTDAEHGPRANAAYAFREGEDTREGTTDADGYLQEWISTRTRIVTIAFVDGPELRLQVGDLDPAHTRRGAAARLLSLGYARPGASLSAVLELFQVTSQLEPTGLLDAATVDKLVAAFGR